MTGTQAGPACGWAMACIEVLLADYRLPLGMICFGLPMEAIQGLLEARACRLNPQHVVGYVGRAIIAARAEMREYILQHYTLID